VRGRREISLPFRYPGLRGEVHSSDLSGALTHTRVSQTRLHLNFLRRVRRMVATQSGRIDEEFFGAFEPSNTSSELRTV
jgi:hypothetical protein